MSKMNFRRLGFAAMTGAALALAGCATPFRADVARFQTQLPAPQGQSFVVETNDPSLEGGIEFGHYANLVEFDRSEEHTSELQSLMRISYAVFCLKKKKKKQSQQNSNIVTNTE